MHIYAHASDFLVLCSGWLFWDNPSAMYKSGPGLYIMHTLYWQMHNMVHCKCWDNMATSLQIIATNGLSSLMMHTSLQNSNGGTFSRLCSIPRPLILHCWSTAQHLIRLLLAEPVGNRAALSGTSSHPQFIPSLMCSNPASRPKPGATVSRYKGLDVS